jgi:histidinol-phosphate aminotransferase
MSENRTGHSFVRPQIRNQPEMGVVKVDPSLHRLQWNENPFDFPADLKEEVLQRLARMPWSRYPVGLRAFDVIDAIANINGLASDQVIVGNGSSDILKVVINAVIQPRDCLLTISPTFSSYATHARQNGGQVLSIPLDPANDFSLPVDAILDQAKIHKAKLLVICAPNNPTGTIYPIEQLRRIVMESNALVLLDAAYGEFCDQNLLPLLAESDRVVIAQTFSKAYALAGVRVGYALSTPEISKELQKLVTNFTLSPFSESAAIVAIENKDRFKTMIASIVAERERLASALSQLPGVTVHSSGTNFLLVNLGKPAKEARSHLLSHQHLLVSEMAMYAGYEDYLRISVGTAEENDLVVSGLTAYLAMLGA